MFPTRSERSAETALTDEERARVREFNEDIKARNEEIRRMWLFTTFTFAIQVGIGAWFFSHRIERVEQDLRELDDDLSIETKLYFMLSEILGPKLNGRWTLEELEEAVRAVASSGRKRWHGTAQMIGASKFAQLLVLKAQQVRLVDVSEDMDGNTFAEYYALVVGNQAREQA